MMGKRKAFIRTDLTTPVVEHVQVEDDLIVIPLENLPPIITVVTFKRGVASGAKQFDFQKWYGHGIDQITYACQRQIERFLDGQDKELTDLSVRTLCQSGLSPFLDYLLLVSRTAKREYILADINRETIDGYLAFLRDSGTSTITQKNKYTNTKSVLKALAKRRLIFEERQGDNETFPRNPFPGLNYGDRGNYPLTNKQRKTFAAAVKKAVMPLFSDDVEPTSELLSYALLIVALHTGRNTWPLLEMSRDSLYPHPKENTFFLVLYKARSHSEDKVVVREVNEDKAINSESVLTVRGNVVKLIRRVFELSDRLREEAPPDLQGRIWLYRMRTSGRGVGKVGQITSLKSGTLESAIKRLVHRYELRDTNGAPLHLNISRLRKTFFNRLYELLDGDIVTTASAGGNTVTVTTKNYLRPSEHAQKNWKFMGITMVEELLSATLGATERTPIGRCSDPVHGDYAPKREGSVCMSFLNCLRCRNYVVTTDDLHRLFSFYWRVLSERARMTPKRWKREFSHIIRLIDQDVVDVGISKGIFSKAVADSERERARRQPHPFWQGPSIIDDIATSEL